MKHRPIDLKRAAVSPGPFLLGLVLACLAAGGLLAQPVAEPALTVTSALVDERGAPAAGVEVVLRPHPGGHELDLDLLGQPGALPEAVDRMRSETDGTFSLRAPAPGPYRLEIRPAPAADDAGDAMPIVYGNLTEFNAPLFLQPTELPDRHPVAVRVLDADGQPIETALVVATPTSLRSPRYERPGRNDVPELLHPRFLRAAARTDAEGIARFLMPTAEANVVVSRPGFVGATARTQASRAAFRLQRHPGLKFLVRGPEGAPAPGVVIRTRGAVGVPLGVTDQDGQVLVSAFTDSDLTFELERADRAFARISQPGPAARETSAVEHVSSVRLEAPRIIYGSVADAESSAPIAGATVLVSGSPGHAALTDQAGAFELRTLPTRSEVRLRAAARGYASAWADARATLRTASADVAIGLRPAAPLFGLVRDASHRPVAGATLLAEPQGASSTWFRRSLRDQPATSIADGSFRFPNALYDTSYRITVRALGFPSTAIDLPPLTRDEAAEPVWIVLTRGRQAVGRIVDTDDNPIPGAEVTLRWPSDSGEVRPSGRLDATRPATTDGRGEFRFPTVRAGEYEVRAVHSEFLAPGNARTEVPEGEGYFDLGSFMLIPGAEIHGFVTDPNGEAVAGATVQIRRLGRDRDGERTATTDRDGAFRLGGLPQEPVVLDVPAAGHAPMVLRQARPGTGEPILIELQAGAALAGHVVDEAGRPVAGARVQVVPDVEQMGWVGFLFWRDSGGRTDGGGRFRFDDLAAGTWSLEATQGAAKAEIDHIELAQGEEREVELRLRRQDQLTVLVTTHLGQPVSDAGIRVVPEEDPYASAWGATDAGGRAQLGVTPGAATVSIEHAEEQNASRDIVLQPGNNELAIQLQPGGTISGVVRSADGGPLAQAGVRALAKNDLELPARARRYLGQSAQTISDRSGLFRLTGLEPGTYFVSAGAPGFARSGPDQPIEIDGQSVNGIDIVLAPGGSITGVVIGLPAADMSQVEITAHQNARLNSTRPDAEGNFTLEDLAPGPWNIVARKGYPYTGRTVERTVTLTSGGIEVFVELPFDRGLRLSGQVLVAGEPMIGGSLAIRLADGEKFQLSRTDHRGRFEISGLEAGSHTLTIQQDGGRMEQRSIDLETDLEGLRIDLQPPGTLTGVILDGATGRPLANASLNAGSAGQIAAIREENGGVPGYAGWGYSEKGGRFRIQFGPGAEQLWVTRYGYQSALLPLSVAPGQHHHGLVIELQPAASEDPNP